MPRSAKSRSRSRRAWRASDTQARHHGAEALKMILGLYAQCKVTAKELSLLCFHLGKAGTPG
eukprot:4622872-Pyramimonas_sp.AAC.1